MLEAIESDHTKGLREMIAGKQTAAAVRDKEESTCIGDTGVELQLMKVTLVTLLESLGEDKKFLIDFDRSCEARHELSRENVN